MIFKIFAHCLVLRAKSSIGLLSMEFLAVTYWDQFTYLREYRRSSPQTVSQIITNSIVRIAGFGTHSLVNKTSGVFQFMCVVMRMIN